MGPTVRKVIEELRRMVETVEALEAEIGRLTQQRQDLRRYLDVDAEKAALAGLQEEKATILVDAQVDAEVIATRARTEAEEIRRKIAETAEQVARTLIAKADAEGVTILNEARAAVTAAQEEARRIVARAQGEAGGLVRDAEATQAAAAKAFADATLALVQVEGREKAVADQERDLRHKHEDLRKHTAAMRAAVISLE